MKKIITASLITSLLLISCVSNNSESKSESEITAPVDQEQSPVSENSISESESQDDKAELSLSEETTVKETESDTETDAEPETESLAQEELEDVFIAQEELVSKEDLLEDLESLEETESQITPESEVTEQEVISEPAKIESVAVNQQENKIKNEESVKQESQKKESTKEIADQKNASDSSDSKASTETAATTSFQLQQELSEASDKINESEKAKPAVPSRTVSINNNQYLDINYPGTGWIYLGEVDRKNLLVFYGRKITDGNTTFTLQSRKSGTAVLHFYKNDALSGKYIDDYVEVTVDANSATDNTHAVSPEYASVVPPKPQKPLPPVEQSQEKEPEVTQAENTKTFAPAQEQKQKPSDPELNIQTIIQNTGDKENKTQEEVLPQTEITEKQSDEQSKVTVELTGDLLEKARKELQDKHYENAFALIKAYLSSASDRIDEALFIEAQILEASSPVQNIKEAIKDYDTIIKNWPASRYWKKSNERSIYLKRFYIDIR